jgi:hypothetical protein
MIRLPKPYPDVLKFDLPGGEVPMKGARDAKFGEYFESSGINMDIEENCSESSSRSVRHTDVCRGLLVQGT